MVGILTLKSTLNHNRGQYAIENTVRIKNQESEMSLLSFVFHSRLKYSLPVVLILILNMVRDAYASKLPSWLPFI
jgi:hypothetical protein